MPMTVPTRLSLSAAVRAAAPPLYRLLRHSMSRFYGCVASAQPQLDSDYYYNYYCEDELEQSRDHLRLAPVAHAEGSITTAGVQWAFIGSPPSKKHVYAEMLSKLLEVPHISMASLVRQELSPRSYLYKQIAHAVNNGKSVPENIIFGLLSKRLEDGYYRGETGFILGGIPRTRVQAEILDEFAEIDLVVNFKCTDDFMAKTKRQGAVAEGTWKKKLQIYAEQSKPLEDYYRKQKKLLEFQVGCDLLETWQQLLNALHLQHFKAARYCKDL